MHRLYCTLPCQFRPFEPFEHVSDTAFYVMHRQIRARTIRCSCHYIDLFVAHERSSTIRITIDKHMQCDIALSDLRAFLFHFLY